MNNNETSYFLSNCLIFYLVTLDLQYMNNLDLIYLIEENLVIGTDKSHFLQ